MPFILGRKLKMTQIFDDRRRAMPVTLVEAGPCYITQIKTEQKDGYKAVQIGFLKKKKNIKKTEKGKEFKYLKEFEIKDEEIEKVKAGDEIKADVFKKGDLIKISGISKGKGFAGVVKRHGFHEGPASHGQKGRMRAPGSIGTSFPERVPKGRRMAGRMGSDRVTVRGLEIIEVDEENNLLAIQGAVPGSQGSLLEIIFVSHQERKAEQEPGVQEEEEKKTEKKESKGGAKQK